MRIVARLLVLLPLLWVEGVWAVDCPPGDYYLKSKAAVDALGATGCDRVSGNLFIGDSTDITNLDGLINITSVGGYLSIYSNAARASLDAPTGQRAIGSL
jgi:hypothetical protein